jgi:hypothetical protein
LSADRELKAMEAGLAALKSLGPEERARVLKWLGSKLNVVTQSPDEPDTSEDKADGKLGTIKQFLKSKSPEEDVARVTTFAYYLTYAEKLSNFKVEKLSTARIDAAVPKFNMSRAIWNTQRSGFLTTAGKRGLYQITSAGEALVEAMPNKAAVEKIKAEGAKRRRKSTASKKTRKGTRAKA